MKYVKLALGLAAVAVCALILVFLLRLGRELIMGGSGVLNALGNEPVEDDVPAPEPEPDTTPFPYGQSGGFIDPQFDPSPVDPDPPVVYGTEGLDLFEVPVDQEADMVEPVP